MESKAWRSRLGYKILQWELGQERAYCETWFLTCLLWLWQGLWFQRQQRESDNYSMCWEYHTLSGWCWEYHTLRMRVSYSQQAALRVWCSERDIPTAVVAMMAFVVCHHCPPLLSCGVVCCPCHCSQFHHRCPSTPTTPCPPANTCHCPHATTTPLPQQYNGTPAASVISHCHQCPAAAPPTLQHTGWPPLTPTMLPCGRCTAAALPTPWHACHCLCWLLFVLICCPFVVAKSLSTSVRWEYHTLSTSR